MWNSLTRRQVSIFLQLNGVPFRAAPHSLRYLTVASHVSCVISDIANTNWILAVCKFFLLMKITIVNNINSVIIEAHGAAKEWGTLKILLFCYIVLATTSNVSALDNGLANTPPMGFNCWGSGRDVGPDISAKAIMELADAFASTGLRDKGYKYLVIDDAWIGGRDAQTNLYPVAVRFPDGMKALTDYVHSKGMKIGIYESPARKTCYGLEGSFGHEQQDANMFAAWGFDYLKYDWCHGADQGETNAMTKMRDCLAKTGRPILLHAVLYGQQRWPGPIVNMWRVCPDATSGWLEFMKRYDIVINANLQAVHGPGHWTEGDTITVGTVKEGGAMSDTEGRAQFSLWCILAQPLMLWTDPRTASPASLAIVGNTEAIAVDQDPLGIMGSKVKIDGDREILVKVLKDSTKAVVLLNRASSSTNMVVSWSDIGLDANAQCSVRDLWQHEDKGIFKGSYSGNVEGHGVLFIKIKQVPPPAASQ
jgi:alpha-galactosidase